ncbi:MAG: hypothetical protein JXA96_09715 [Sedimentisphaerales bacterium]|nr:hypothetical protein [Sedimentisphaerales bacterium]
MMKRKIFISGLIFSCFLAFSGCIVEKKTTPNSGEGLVSYKNDMTAEALEHAQQMQMLAIRLQDENAVLKARNEELTKQLESLQAGHEVEKKEPVEPLNPDTLEQEYRKLQDDNEEMRKLVLYERGLREDLMRKIDQDQITIKELKIRLGE